MPDPLTTTVTELPESRVRVEVRVPPQEIGRSVERKARELAGSLKLPGFRKGKVPTPLVIQRLGREVVTEEAVRDALGGWYVDALDASGIVPVGDPKIDLGELPQNGGGMSFSFEIGVLPKATLGEYRGLEVGRAEPEVPVEEIDREVDGLRDRLARLEAVERPAESGDFVVLDYVGSLVGEDGAVEPFAGGEGRDELIELGSGNLIAGFEEGLLGAAAGEERTLALTFPAEYPNEALAGRPTSFEVTVKEVKRKELPDADDDLAIDTGFDSIAELRADIERRLRETREQTIERDFREAALDAAVANATVEVPEALVQGRAREMWERMLHSLSHRGISREAYLEISGRSEEEMLADVAPDAERALRREAVLTAVVAAEEISPSEADLLDAVTPTAGREGMEPEEVLDELRAKGRLEELREDLAARQAMDLIAREAKPIALEQAAAREALWTPEKERAEREREQGAAGESGPAGGLWTPDR
ncbi:MAG TPA: trigger factor [Solirubrobacteraceae bacterium]|nr:trigger factor [Solirubrobacteraceae bacterium]